MSVVQVPCICEGLNPGCALCAGTAKVAKPACRRCNGKGTLGGAKCLDCRGAGWRSLDVLVDSTRFSPNSIDGW